MKKKNKQKEEKKQRPRFDVHSDAIKALWGVGLIILFFLTILAFMGRAGVAGAVFADAAKSMFGLGRFIIPLVFLAASFVLFTSYRRNSYIPLLIGVFLFISGVLGILHIFSPHNAAFGGYWGRAAAGPLIGIFGGTASLIVLAGTIVAAVIVAFNIRIAKILEQTRNYKNKKEEEEKGEIVSSEKPEFKVKTWQERESQNSNLKSQNHPEAEQARYGGGSSKLKSYEGGDASPNLPNHPNIPKDPKDSFSSHDFPPLTGDFRLPPLELLEKETGKPSSGDIIANANIIKRTLQNFGIEVEMGEVNVGPTVTQFTLKPAEGIKLSRILALNNDLSLALAAHPIRIEAPIPGRSLVGIEIPNKGITIVRLKNLLESAEFQKRSGGLCLALGRDVSGAPICANLAKMPHLLIAGSTGSGKTICLNILILSLLYQNPPSLLKFILIDPKRVEFPVYSDIPHLLAPVVVDTQKTINALKWAVSEMERRFEVLAAAKARDIGSFNGNRKIVAEAGPMPYIVVVIDELADLMAARGKEMEALVVRLAQMARAVGIHLVLATQRPSVEVITGLIKANITSRIAFQVASQVDSRTVLDMAGAEKLLGNGDMLYLSGDASKPRRIQGAYITEKEVRRVADYLREEAGRMKEGLEEKKGLEGEEGLEEKEGIGGLDITLPNHPNRPNFDFEEGEGATDDELYEEAKKLVVQAQKASASLLQRRLKVGYARAARLIDMLEENGVVGPGEGAKPREVYMGKEEEEYA